MLGGIPYDHKYTYARIGYNLNNTEMAAAIGVEQLKRLPGFLDARRRNFKILDDKMQQFSDFFILPRSIQADTPWFGYPLTVKTGQRFTRMDIMRFLNDKGIGTRLVFAGNVVRQPAYKDVKFHIDGTLTNSDYIMANTFWVGSWHGLTVEQMEYTAEIISEFIGTVE
jgi:CDP-6-deoxy-D-xylo-4-hexulose-3-dehydrase